MLHVLGCITDQHDLRLVVLAGLLCALSSWTAVSLVTRAGVSAGRTRLLWTLGAGGVFGAGVWGTHFVAMLAYQSAFFIGYGLLLTLASIVIAAVFSTVGFTLVLRGLAVTGGAIVGLAISGMHYVGMAALVGPFDLKWDASYVAASVLLAVGFAALAALAGTRMRNVRGRALAATLFTLGIVGLHFTAMSSVVLMPDPQIQVVNAVLAPGILALAIAAVALLIVSLGLTSALLDSHLTLQRSGEEARLRTYIAALEAARAQQEVTSADLRSALARASEAATAKSAFLAAMSHELRTPLNAIIGFSDLLLSGAANPSRQQEYLGDIRAGGANLLRLVNDILEFARMDSGQLTVREEGVCLADLLRSAIDASSAVAAPTGIAIHAELAVDLPNLTADARMLSRAFSNLVSNAVKFTPPGGEVFVSADAGPSGVVVTIRDTGIGIAASDIPRALDRFGQVDAKIARRFEGAGLGLPLARDYIGLHGGTLTLESVVGMGTTVTVTLPPERLAPHARAAA